MPELPEVETMCRGITPIIGRRINAVRKPRCAYRPISIKPRIDTINRRLIGKRVTDVTRLGKRVLVHIDGSALVFQPKMTGLVLLEQPPDPDHVRLQIEFAARASMRLLYWDRRGLGTVELLHAADIHQRIVEGRLGPDALEIRFPDFSRRLGLTSRPVKLALLDQSLVAGIGNLYASEMLHLARIHPAAPCDRLSYAKKRTLYESMRHILEEAIRYEGSTLADGTYRNALNNPGSYQNQHAVYDRAGQPCTCCATGNIKRIVQTQRSTYFCPNCQRLPRQSRP